MTSPKKFREYYQSCPSCGRGSDTGKDKKDKIKTVTELGVEGGDYADYPLNRVRFECECGAKFTIPLPDVKSEMARRWEAGERI